jgi:dihydrofolate reductase
MKTFESFPKPLPNRTHIVISRQDNYKPEGIVVSSMEKAIAICQTTDVYIIGGGYNLGISFQTKLNSRASITTLKQMLFPRNKS